MIDDSIVYRRQSEMLPVANATDESKTVVVYLFIIRLVMLCN